MKKIFGALFMMAAVGLTSCSSDTDNLEKDVDALTDRITALEKQTESLNDNLAALQVLVQKGITISQVDFVESTGVYTLQLSNGESIQLAQKAGKQELALQVGIDKDGFWQVSYDGIQFEQIKVDGQPVKAKGEDGKTPLFRVNTKSYWEVSTDGGTTYTAVLDENGKPVKAIAETQEDDFFTSVTATDEALEVVLKDGNKISIPVVKDFFCYFGEELTEIQSIKAGETEVYKVHIRGAEHVMLNAPQGWNVVLGEANAEHIAELQVTAPRIATRALADNSKDVSILAVKGVFAQIAKMQVELGEGETVVDPDPDPETTDMYITPLAVNTPVVLLLNTDPTNEAAAYAPNDFWFTRFNKKTLEEVAENGSIELVEEQLNGKKVTAAQFDCKIANSFFKLALGYYKQDANCDVNKLYKLSFKVKGAAKSRFQAAVRTGDGANTVTVYNKEGEPTTTLTTYEISEQNDGNTWEEVEIIYDFQYKGPKVASIDPAKNPLSKTTTQDVKALDFRFYPQAKNTTFLFADVKFEEYHPASK